MAGRAFPRPDLPGADAAGHRSGASVPVHPQPRLHAWRSSCARRRDGEPLTRAAAAAAADRALHPPAGRRPMRASSRSRTLIRAVPRPAVPRLRRQAAGRLPRHPRQRHRNRGRGRGSGALFETALKRRRRGAVIRLKIDSRRCRTTLRRLRAAGARRRRRRGRSSSTACSALADLAQLIDDDRPDLKFEPYNPRFPERIRDHGGDCFAAIRAEGHRRPPPLRELRRGGAVPAARRRAIPTWSRSSRRSTAPATTVPIVARADRGGRGRQVGHRAGRAEGALRRGGQHPLGARSGARRRAGRLRLHRAEDPRQAVAGGAPRGRRSSRTYVPFRHRQLSPGHRAHLHRPVASSPPIRCWRATRRRCFNYITGYAEPTRAGEAWRSRR